jgi:hypothetical protein
MRRLFIYPERIDDESENYDYHITNCDRVNSNSSHPTACILLIGGGEENTPGEDAAT